MTREVTNECRRQRHNTTKNTTLSPFSSSHLHAVVEEEEKKKEKTQDVPPPSRVLLLLLLLVPVPRGSTADGVKATNEEDDDEESSDPRRGYGARRAAGLAQLDCTGPVSSATAHHLLRSDHVVGSAGKMSDEVKQGHAPSPVGRVTVLYSRLVQYLYTAVVFSSCSSTNGRHLVAF